jgi:hypothetical protein
VAAHRALRRLAERGIGDRNLERWSERLAQRRGQRKSREAGTTDQHVDAARSFLRTLRR